MPHPVLGVSRAPIVPAYILILRKYPTDVECPGVAIQG